MKWLVLADAQNCDEATNIESFFKKQKIPCTVLDFALGAQNFFDSKKNLQSANKFIEKITHCLCIANGDEVFCQDFFYLFGAFVAQKTQIFTITKDEQNLAPILQQGKNFNSQNQFISKIAKILPSIIEQEKKQNALAKLQKQGFAFAMETFFAQIKDGNMDACKLFLEAGMSANAKNGANLCALSVAVRLQKLDIVSLLLKAGAFVDEASSDRGYTPLMDAVWKKNCKIVELILAYKPNVNTVAQDGQTPLILATCNGSDEICAMLVESGADMNVKDHMGMSAISYANLFKKQKIISIFEKV